MESISFPTRTFTVIRTRGNTRMRLGYCPWPNYPVEQTEPLEAGVHFWPCVAPWVVAFVTEIVCYLGHEQLKFGGMSKPSGGKSGGGTQGRSKRFPPQIRKILSWKGLACHLVGGVGCRGILAV